MMNFGSGPLGMILVWVFFLALIVLAGYLLIRLAMSTSKTAPEDSGPESALDILDKRYARGEIETEEYRQKKEEITG
jgi:putative membrane protein